MQVRLWDQAPDAVAKARDYIADVLADLERNDLLNGHSPEAVLARIVARADLAEALDGATHIQENTPEDLDTKIKVFSLAR